MKTKDILIKNPFGNHIYLSVLESKFLRILKSKDDIIFENGVGGNGMKRQEWLKTATKILKDHKKL